MRTSANTEVRPTPGLRGPVGTFWGVSLVGAVVLLLTTHDTLGFGAALGSVLPVLAVFLGAAALIAHGLHTHYPHTNLGWCNIVTFARLVIVALLAIAILEARVPDMILLGLAIFSLCLDGVDGWLARRQGLVSSFGARFDVEVDATFALTLALYAAVTGIAGPYVVLLGLPYYLFTAARRLWPWLAAPLPESLARKAVCVVQIAVLIALLVPWIPAPVLNAAILAVIAALAWSFGRDILWLTRRRGA